MTHPYFAGARHPRVLAHRGLLPESSADSSLWENTAGAFAAAHAAGVEYIETDCRATADGDAVLLHDPTLQRLAGDERAVAEVRTAELSRMFEDHGGLLTVADALDAFPEIRFNIDVKAAEAAEPTGRAVAAHAHRVLITSFSERNRTAALESAAYAGAALRPATAPGRSAIIRLRLLSGLRLPSARVLKGIDAIQVPERHAGVQVFTPVLVRAAHRAGVEVHVWTVDDPDAMRGLIDAGADGIVTNRADLALSTI
ncbi:glycerophosphodiester phosphodiesterase family protein [Microbacterium soli]|uniref:Glycerophosphodiester phosphodiesterase n=1 Tax=Microbacterium soli TaxID=446075 RepID=A0ABP7NGG5_9MICO